MTFKPPLNLYIYYFNRFREKVKPLFSAPSPFLLQQRASCDNLNYIMPKKTLCIREESEEIERRILHPKATLSCNTNGRQKPEEEGEIRTAFQRDRDRIINSKSFRRLKHKTQA